MSRDHQPGLSPRALLAGSLLAALMLLGGLQASARLAPLRPVEHVLANRPPVTPAVTFDAPEFALVVASRALPAPAVSQFPVLRPAPALHTRLGQFSHYIRPPPFA